MVQIGDMFVDGKNPKFNFEVIEITGSNLWFRPIAVDPKTEVRKDKVGPRTTQEMLSANYKYIPCQLPEVKEIDWI